MASNDPEHRDEEEAHAPGGEEEDTGAHVAPIVRLEEVSITTGEEEEDVLLDLKAKLYRFSKEGNQWKERGTDTDFSNGELKEEMFCIRFGSVENCIRISWRRWRRLPNPKGKRKRKRAGKLHLPQDFWRSLVLLKAKLRNHPAWRPVPQTRKRKRRNLMPKRNLSSQLLQTDGVILVHLGCSVSVLFPVRFIPVYVGF